MMQRLALQARGVRIAPKQLSSHLYGSSRAFTQLQAERPASREVVRGPTRMLGSEAFVETLVSQGVTDVFGIVGKWIKRT